MIARSPNAHRCIATSGAALLLLVLGCARGGGPRELRGRATASPDGGTYLVIADANGGQCGPLRVDGQPWPHALHAAGRVTPGAHVISCGTEVTVRVDSGRTFEFDYWGP